MNFSQYLQGCDHPTTLPCTLYKKNKTYKVGLPLGAIAPYRTRILGGRVVGWSDGLVR